jgi:hypothetical protein
MADEREARARDDDDDEPRDGMNDDKVGDEAGGMPAEFVDLPGNEPGTPGVRST